MGQARFKSRTEAGTTIERVSSSVQVAIIGYECPQLHTFVSLPSHQADGTNQLFFLILGANRIIKRHQEWYKVKRSSHGIVRPFGHPFISGHVLIAGAP